MQSSTADLQQPKGGQTKDWKEIVNGPTKSAAINTPKHQNIPPGTLSNGPEEVNGTLSENFTKQEISRKLPNSDKKN